MDRVEPDRNGIDLEPDLERNRVNVLDRCVVADEDIIAGCSRPVDHDCRAHVLAEVGEAEANRFIPGIDGEQHEVADDDTRPIAHGAPCGDVENSDHESACRTDMSVPGSPYYWTEICDKDGARGT
jgi:hypothetical protein